ncbi:tail fiber domain-containing protein [Mucilaginibacter sp.]|uniref:tail fiber domain-containing protein n=1 Tax=Mucilaginibacter sp. TaxID=1882438 RepID=UPI003266051D
MKNTSPTQSAKATWLSACVNLFILAVLIVAQTSIASAQKKQAAKPVKKALSAPLRSIAGTDVPALYISPDGNVGIGTNNPVNKLQLGADMHVNGNAIYFRQGPDDKYDFVQWNRPQAEFPLQQDDKLDMGGYRGVRIGDMMNSGRFFPVLAVGRTWSFNNVDRTTPAVDIKREARPGDPPQLPLALYVTGPMNNRGEGVEFRNNDGSEGLGFTKNQMYQTADNQNINFGVRGDGNITFSTRNEERLYVNSLGLVNVSKDLNVDEGFNVKGNSVLKNLNITGQITLGWHDRNITAVDYGGGIYMEFKNTNNGNGNRGFRFTEDNGTFPILRIKGNFVGIGTDDPKIPLHVVTKKGGDAYDYQHGIDNENSHELDADGVIRQTASTGRKYSGCSILAEGEIASKSAVITTYSSIYSDLRLKKNIRPSSSAQDLNTLRQIQVADYKMIDTIADNKAYKKVIAQQVQKVYPLAVRSYFNTLPDVFQAATQVAKLGDSTYLITVARPQNLKAGDELELKCKPASSVTVRVTKINTDRSFVVTSTIKLDEQEGVFVYGRPANDVLTVDYDAISMLNVSATQQLAQTVDEQKKLIQQLTLENEKLRKEQAESKTTVNAILVRLTQMEESKSKPQGSVTAQAPGSK